MEKICHDPFQIAVRMKQIDVDYAIYRNHALARFEVFWRGKFAFVVPFDTLDVRTLVYTKKTRRENADEIEREIDEGNQAIWAAQEQQMQRLKNKIKDYAKYDFERFN